MKKNKFFNKKQIDWCEAAIDATKNNAELAALRKEANDYWTSGNFEEYKKAVAREKELQSEILKKVGLL